MLYNNNDNAAVRNNYTADIYNTGVADAKKEVLTYIGQHYSEPHINGTLHIHDLESYGKIFNCCMPQVTDLFNSNTIIVNSTHGKITYIFEQIKQLIINIASNQSGGIGFANFDIDIGNYLEINNVPTDETTQIFFKDCMRQFLEWVNTTYTRNCREPYYVSLNVGLGTSYWARTVLHILLEEYMNMTFSYVRPNIIFKVNRSINGTSSSPNFDLYNLALKSTALRMVPTYLLTDSSPNKNTNPYKLGIMGCRTRVYQNINGEETSIGRGNLAYVSINLPQLALISSSIPDFYIRLSSIMSLACNLLLTRSYSVVNNPNRYYQYFLENNIWSNVHLPIDFIKQGTLSVGFIGLTEAVEVLTGNKFYLDNSANNLAIEIVKTMRHFVDERRSNEELNYTLLATSGEMISGRFCSIDKINHRHSIHDKNFYTNSFHVDVDSTISVFDKLKAEGPFHNICNGGCITYIEFGSSLLTNTLAIDDAISYAVNNNISYLGFNFPLDICNHCNCIGTFDICTSCGSKEIQRIRRVSGYLEVSDYFTKGKKAEMLRRSANI